jgi:predicted HTH transcriptional regulator
MTSEQLQDIAATGEDQGLEFKTEIPAVELIARHLAAFANTAGGRLLLGMGSPRADDGEVAFPGVDPDRAVNSIIRAAEHVEPRPHVRTEVVLVDGRPVVIADVAPWASVPVIAGGVAYVRKGAFTTQATADDLLNRAVQKAVIRAADHLDRDSFRDALREALRGPVEAIERQGSEIQRLRFAGKRQGRILWMVIAVLAALGVLASLLVQLNR